MGRFNIDISTSRWNTKIPYRDLQFTKSDRGGFTSATLSIAEDVNERDLAVAAGSRCTFYDRGGRVAWQGYLDLPGKDAARDGHVWNLGVLGTSTLLTDKSQPYIGIETSLDGFYRRRSFSASATGAIGPTPDGGTATAPQALVLSVPGGTVVANGVIVAMEYDRLVVSGQVLGGVGMTRLGGKADATWNAEVAVFGDDGTPAIADLFSVNLAVGPTVSAARVVVTDWTAGADMLRFKLARDGGATTVADDTTWIAYYDIYVAARRLAADGTSAVSADHGRAYVLAHEIAVDAAQRLTTLLNVANARVDTTFTYQIDQLAYPDGTRLADLMSDLCLLEPDLTFGVFELPLGATAHKFRVGRYGTTARYEADTSDGWEQAGGELNPANEITVYYNDKHGHPQSVTVTTAMPGLDQWGRVRSADSVDLGSEVGSAAAATQVANGILAQTNTLPYAGTLTVARPIRDLLLGRMVWPWEIEPGYLMSIRDLTDSPLLRLTETTYTDSSMSTACTLGTPAFSTDELVQRLANRRHRKGGRPVAAAYA